MSDFFDLPEESISKPKNSQRTKKVDPNVYDPDPNQFNGSYKSVIRFVPYLADKKLSKYTKYSAKFWNPLTKESLIVDCPSNVEKPSILWSIEQVMRALKKEEPELVKEIESCFSRWYTHHSPVYIKKDPQRPELEGKLLILKFRNQIDQLIEQQLHPEEIDGLESSRKINPYHLLEGKDFLCIVGKKTKEFRDWSKCKFMDEVSPFVFKIDDRTIQVKNDEKIVRIVNDFLVKNTPSLDEYLHQEWTQDTYEQVAEAVIAAIPQKTILEMVLEKSKDSKVNELIRSKMKGASYSVKKESPLDDDLNFSSTSKSTESEDSDEFDDLFKNL